MIRGGKKRMNIFHGFSLFKWIIKVFICLYHAVHSMFVYFCIGDDQFSIELNYISQIVAFFCRSHILYVVNKIHWLQKKNWMKRKSCCTYGRYAIRCIAWIWQPTAFSSSFGLKTRQRFWCCGSSVCVCVWVLLTNKICGVMWLE